LRKNVYPNGISALSPLRLLLKNLDKTYNNDGLLAAVKILPGIRNIKRSTFFIGDDKRD